ncbi:MAG: dUTP diphosphatase [Clostridiales bacterium]|nr:dUTP diphosphatase [Clostridiales bacterium]
MKKVVKFKKLNPDAIIPDYAHPGDAGMDLYSVEDMVIEPLTWKLVPTGLACELPEGTEGQVRSKSGIALKNGVFVLNTPGTVDENYRGEIGVVLYNLNTKENFVIKKGQKIAQYVINCVEYVDTIEVKELSENKDRGAGGFGSTGLGKNKKA